MRRPVFNRKPGKGATTTALLTLPFVVTILLFVVGPALGLTSGSTSGTTTTTTGTTSSTPFGTTTGSTGTTGGTDTTGTGSTSTDQTAACSTSTDQTTTGSTTTTGLTPTTPGSTTTTGSTTTSAQTTTSSRKSSSRRAGTGTTTSTGPTSTGTTTTSTDQTSTDQTSTDQTSACPMAGEPQDPNSPAVRYSVINGTANAATDHERIGSSAFPNFANGAVDNYYSLAHAHVDGSPFAEGTASPGDTGPIGQTAAAGNTQQPQYADARWPGDSASGQATFGNQGGPYAAAEASDYKATAESSAASSSSGGSPSAGSSKTMAAPIAVPKGFDLRLRHALERWKAKWADRLGLKLPTSAGTPVGVATPTAPALTPPSLPAGTTPAITVPGVATVPSTSLPGVTVPAVTVPKVTMPSLSGPSAAGSSRSLSSSSGGTTTAGTTTTDTTTTGTTTTPSGDGPPPDGAALLESSTKVLVDPDTHALVTSGESTLGRVSIGNGQILLRGIHVTASITNAGSAATDSGLPGGSDTTSTGTDTSSTGTSTSPFPAPPGGTTATDTTTTSTGATDTTSTGTGTGPTGSAPTYKVSIRVAEATIGGVPVTIDEDGVHVAGQSQALPYQQASDALNGALKQAGIQLFLVGPQLNTTNGEETIDATGVHVVFTQPTPPPGMPQQFVEHILGEVFVDSLAVLAPPLQAGSFSGGPLGSLAGGKTTTKGKPGGASKHVGGSVKGATSSSSGSFPSGSSSSSSFPSGSSGGTSGSFGGVSAASQPASSSTGTAPQSFPAAVTSALHKPMWLLLAYLLWQGLMIAAGAAVWHWRRGDTS